MHTYRFPRAVARILALGAIAVGTPAVVASSAQASSQYPYPSGLIGSKSTSGSTLNGTAACLPHFAGGDTDSSYEVLQNRMIFEAASRGRIQDGTQYFTSQAFGGRGPYDQTCLNTFVYKNGYGAKERQNAVTIVYGHGSAVTGRNEQSWTGNFPFYVDGDSRNGAPLYICTNRWAPTTAC